MRIKWIGMKLNFRFYKRSMCRVVQCSAVQCSALAKEDRKKFMYRRTIYFKMLLIVKYCIRFNTYYVEFVHRHLNRKQSMTIYPV